MIDDFKMGIRSLGVLQGLTPDFLRKGSAALCDNCRGRPVYSESRRSMHLRSPEKEERVVFWGVDRQW